jgi:hypothetical protein
MHAGQENCKSMRSACRRVLATDMLVTLLKHLRTHIMACGPTAAMHTGCLNHSSVSSHLDSHLHPTESLSSLPTCP